MPENVAFVFDTNFIIQNLNLKEVVNKLIQKDYSVYVPQVAIDERIAQVCIKQKSKYKKLEDFKKETEAFASITIIKQYSDTENYYKTQMQKNYNNLQNSTIIPFTKSSSMFERILERAYMKVPPFITAGTDKGFKDSLMWLSILDYFTSNGENKVVFVSSDNGFRENSTYLCQEFEKVTGKTIEIKDNAYYKEITETIIEDKGVTTHGRPPNLNQLRERIQIVLEPILGVESEDYWGGPVWERTFTTSNFFDVNYMSLIFNGLKNDIEQHIFDQNVSACDILALDERITNGNVQIPLSALENAWDLYNDIKNNYPEYIQQFYLTAANILNRNYVPAKEESIDDDDLPF